LCGLAIALAIPAASARERQPTTRLTIELDWGDPALPTLPLAADSPSLEISIEPGRIVDVVTIDGDALISAPAPDPARRSFRAGSHGRVRLRVEANEASTLLIRRANEAARFPLAGISDSSQRSPAPLAARVHRLPWDPIEIDRVGGDGTYAPGAPISLSVAVNALGAGPSIQVAATIKRKETGEVVWTGTKPLNEANDRSSPLIWNLTAPPIEGTYEIEFTALAESARPGNDSQAPLIGRLFKRLRDDAPVGARRRVTFAVLDPKAAPASTEVVSRSQDAVVDLVDLTRVKPGRVVTAGRSGAPFTQNGPWPPPRQALEIESDPTRRERLLGLIARSSDLSVLGPADPTGLAWVGANLKVAHPGRPHRLSITVTNGRVDSLAVALLGPGRAPHALLDACVSDSDRIDQPCTYTWIVWPDSPDTIAMVVNRGERSAVRVGAIELREMPAEPPSAAVVETESPNKRSLAIQFSNPRALERFGARGVFDDEQADWLAVGKRLAAYLRHCGANAVVINPRFGEFTARQSLDQQAVEDSIGPDPFELVLKILEREGVSVVIEWQPNGPLEGLPPPGSSHARERGIVRYLPDGQADSTAYPLFNPDVRDALRRELQGAVASRMRHANVVGVLVRLGPGSTLPGGAELIPDDSTYQAFLQSAFGDDDRVKIPGQTGAEADRMRARGRFLSEAGEKPWLEWRAAELGRCYAEFAESVDAAAPGARLLVATPAFDDPATELEAIKTHDADLPPIAAWRALGFDPPSWPSGLKRPILIRSIPSGHSERVHDLVTSPDFDGPFVTRSERGVICGARVPTGALSTAFTLQAAPTPFRSDADEPIAHGLAALDPQWMIMPMSTADGREEKIARFARILRSLPADAPNGPAIRAADRGVAVRSWVVKGSTILALANDMPYRVLLESNLRTRESLAIVDLGRQQRLIPADSPQGGKSLVIELPPFGAASVRVDNPSVAIEPGTLYLPTLAEIQSRADAISGGLNRLLSTSHAPLLPNSRCEPTAPDLSPTDIRPAAYTPGIAGWFAIGDPKATVAPDPDRPHEGRGSARLSNPEKPASLVSEYFAAPFGSKLMLNAWLRAGRPKTAVRILIEGESQGRPISRESEMIVGTEWTELRLQAAELPTQGLDRVRLRFEIRDPGVLWVDDVSLAGDRESPEMFDRTRRVLTAAYTAFRERRYADFARLSASPLARAAATPIVDEPPLRTGRAPTSDLPPGRRLR
jgi:hypothetical protein